MAKIGRFLYGTWYGSSICIAVVLGLIVWVCHVEVSMLPEKPAWIVPTADGLAFALALAFVNGLVAVVVSVVKLRGIRAFVQLCCEGMLFLVAAFVMIGHAFQMMASSSEDHLADNWEVPTDIVVSDPVKLGGGGSWFDKAFRDDAYSLALSACATNAAMSREKVLCDISSLDRLAQKNGDLLKRYLASHPGWRLRNERFEGLTAKRKTRQHGRFLDGSNDGWSMCLPVASDHESSAETMVADCRIHFSKFRDWGIRCKSGEETKVTLEGDVGVQKRCQVICSGKKITLTASEESRYDLSRVLQPMFDFTKAEFDALEKAGDWKMAKKLLPADAIRKGEASLELFKGFQGGIFTYLAWVNPGERGEVYLKAYEVTTGARLSQDRLRDWTQECVGWSEDPDEKFSVSSQFTIYEGDWEKYYAARIELWFVPANGGNERKLTERIFKVDGWMQ